MYWNINTLISGLAILIFLAIYLVVLFSKPLTRLRELFLFYLFVMIFWSISAFLASSGMVPVLPWFRAMSASPMAMLLILYLFVQNLFGLRSKWKPLFVLYGICSILGNLFSNFIIKSAYLDKTGSLVYEFGLLLPIIALPGVLLVMSSLGQLIYG